MSHYIVNKNAQDSGEHEIHNENSCAHLPNAENRISIGYFNRCEDAVAAAKQQWPSSKFDGCKHCSPDCHNV